MSTLQMPTSEQVQHVTPRQAALQDHIGNAVYAAHYEERRTSRIIISGLSLALLGCLGAIGVMASKPTVNRYIRIDEIGRAQAIQYSDLSYSPREGEVRTYLTDWANYRFTINRETIAIKYPLNYYFLSQQLSSQLMGEDNANHLVTEVVTNKMEQSEVEVKNVTITSMTTEAVAGTNMAKGTATINLDRIYSPRNSQQPRTEHWEVSLTYYLNPRQVSEQARLFPQFETINPLGLTVTSFIQNRETVEAASPEER